ncbi:hypothetical protein [Limisalsivibrio acetivorans]|uniref:hypothetical protein n=1 Tax=Limisalsivibrio acetivorans TaxID=1304888 RepID=UPI0003B6E476|nr:hypothetical protein [Limisalsivibrio acetivorans]
MEELKSRTGSGLTDSFLDGTLPDEKVEEVFVSSSVPEGDEPLWVYWVLEKRRNLLKPLFRWLKERKVLFVPLAEDPLFQGETLVYLIRMMKNVEGFTKALLTVVPLDEDLFNIFVDTNDEDTIRMIYEFALEDEGRAARLMKNPFVPEPMLYALGEKAGREQSETAEEIEQNLYAQLKDMTIAQKIKLAMKGNKSARTLLMRSPNKQISTAAIRNPKVTDDEVEFISKNKNTGEHIIREIVLNKEWMKKYTIVSALAQNPKTPLDISMGLLGRLMPKDVENISRSKDVPNTLKVSAARIIEQKGKK